MYVEIEEKLLGTYSDTPDLFDNIEHLVGPHLFSGINKNVYKFIKENHRKGVITEGATLYNYLKTLGVSEKKLKETCIKLTTRDLLTKSAPYEKVKILFDNYVRDVMKPILHQSYLDFHSGIGEVNDTLTTIKNKITDIDAVINNVNRNTSIKDVFKTSLTTLKELKEGKREVGYPTGLQDLDNKTGGITKGVTVVGAVPGAGKSSLIVSIIKNNAIDKDNPVVFFSIEMSAEQVMTNLWANMFELNSFALRLGDIETEQIKMIEKSENKFRDNLTIDDNPNVTWQYIESKIKQMRKSIPMSKMIIAVIDYLQIMSCTADEYKEGTEKQMSIRCNKLANLAKQYNVGLIELSQLSREVGKRNPPRPMISDLKESGAIEANAQQIWLLYRPDYYDKNAVDEKGDSLKGVCEINRAKNRYGPTGYTYVRFKAQYSQFLDREEKHEF